MRNSTLTRYAGCCLLLAALVSCGPKKRIVSPESSAKEVSRATKTAVMEQVMQQQLHYATFSGRAKSNLTIDGKQRYDATANIRIVHDEAIWISVTAFMGIEAVRVLITPDSIKIINRLQSEYIEKPFAYLHHFTGNGLDFSSLERLLVGDVIEQIMEDDVEVWQRADGYLLQKHTDGLQYAVRVDNDHQNSQTSITTPARSQQLEAFYSDYQTTGGNAFPNQMEISIVTPRLTLQSSMRYSKVVYDENIELPFAIPSRYMEVQ